MVIVKKALSLLKKKERTIHEEKERLVKHLKELQKLETKLWGVTVNHLANGEEQVLEDTNHLIHLITHGRHEKLKTMLNSKEVKDFLNDIRALKDDFAHLRKEIKQKDKLKNMITAYTIQLVDHKTYHKMEEIFILEKQLYDVIEKQEEELEELYKHMSAIKVDISAKKTEVFLGSLTKIRRILAGHMDHHALWEEDRQGYSNTSNILNSLIKAVNQSFV